MADLKKKPGKKRKWNRDDTELTILAFPTAVWYLLFSFLPMFGIIIAFKKYTINGGFLHSILTARGADWTTSSSCFRPAISG